MINFRTDLALERRDLFKKANNISNEVDGLETQEESFTSDSHDYKTNQHIKQFHTDFFCF